MQGAKPPPGARGGAPKRDQPLGSQFRAGGWEARAGGEAPAGAGGAAPERDRPLGQQLRAGGWETPGGTGEEAPAGAGAQPRNETGLSAHSYGRWVGKAP
ncbi:hypothetical protein GCM10023097_35850 [Streptomyces collinus]